MYVQIQPWIERSNWKSSTSLQGTILSGIISFLFIRLKRCLLRKEWHDLVGTWWRAIELCNTDKTGILDNSIVRACNNPPASSSIVDVENEIEAAGLAVLTNPFGNDWMSTKLTTILEWRSSVFFPNVTCSFSSHRLVARKFLFTMRLGIQLCTAALPSPSWTVSKMISYDLISCVLYTLNQI